MKTYRRIAARLSLDEIKDASATVMLASLLEDVTTISLESLRTAVAGKAVGIWGAGPSLERDLAEAIRCGCIGSMVNLVADGAVTAFLERNKVPAMLFTDLDGPGADLLKANSLGSIAVVHAHGDNVPAVQTLATSFTGMVVGSTQVCPVPPKVLNLGGFTDGDRAAHWAHELGASAILLFGMDLGTAVGWYSKRGLSGDLLERKMIKLDIAGSLLSSLSRRARIYNFTSAGNRIPGVPNASFGDFDGIMVKVKSNRPSFSL